ncbi:Histone family protein nucleoid-structuring protein H-NS [Paraburkholderia piptadeniae]|uniref:Histone family protein nucleoid-structuring protein H-NS n=1 Tax=Paraburkholderia piptadeniae TaxID=1701573 RepID=A0A1N7SK36_9BURK|nr:H-NS family nucleoid-associated regulatory protein [Paraburkholderia piptadeniae]SIT47771.1 Histone family protein nucleoid-structuring protein H-NS [Paraburkholderia piptadeniae]
MATLEQVQARIAKLQAQAGALANKQSSTVIAKIRDLMEKHGLTIADIDAHIGGKKRGRKPGSKAAVSAATSAKYRDPKTGATWTGHGRAPAWIASVKDRTKFLIDGSAVQAAAVPKTAAKAGNYVRGPQAAKYRDPKSGATWSGRGRAPAWLAGAKDRSKFLIAGAEEGVAASKPAVAKKAAANKTATAGVAKKKVAAKKSKTVARTPSAKKAAVKKSPAKKAVARKAPANGTAAASVMAPGVAVAPTEAS